MGASDFYQTGQGKTVQEAFRAARDEALYEYGHRGYTGTLAEKNDFVVIDAKPANMKEAMDLAHKLVSENDGRIDDKWGPAGAIRVDKDKWLFFGVASS